MVDVAYLFPGQGAQTIGMGKDLYEAFPECRRLYDEAGRILGLDLARACFEGPTDTLTRTDISQPAIFVTSAACLAALHLKLAGKFVPRFAAGLSLGEYTALYAAGALTFEEGVKLVRKRGLFMEEASRSAPGTMASLIGVSKTDAEGICRESGAEIGNLNSPGQVVISGSRPSVEKAVELAKSRGAARTVMLEVSGAFHSSLMGPAAANLRRELAGVSIQPPRFPVISNVTARPETAPDEIRENLAVQVNHTTNWEGSVLYVASQGILNYLEIGPGNVLRGLLRRIDSRATCYNMDGLSAVDRLVSTLA